jgi:uncharacterized protein (DUF58 family)
LNHFAPPVLAKLKNLHLRARAVVDGLMTGIHPSRAKGFSAEFEEHREYAQGDDIRHIDWKAYGKSDRYFIKEYREATNLRGYILLDGSSSMSYASDGWSKFDYGATLAASMAYLMLKQQDSVGLITFSQKIDQMIPPQAGSAHLFTVLKGLEDKVPQGATAAGAILQELAGSLKRRGIIILISDLLDRPEEVLRGLKQLRSKGNDVIVFHLLDRDELEFPFKDPTVFEDLEEDLKLLTDPPAIRSAYRKAIQSLIEGYRQSCAAYRIDYALFDTSVGLDRALMRYLTWREKFRKG